MSTTPTTPITTPQTTTPPQVDETKAQAAPDTTSAVAPTQAQRDAETAANARVAAAKKELADAEAAAALAKAKLRPTPKSLDLTKPFVAKSTGVNELTIHQAGFPLGGPLSPHDAAVVTGWLSSIARAD